MEVTPSSSKCCHSFCAALPSLQVSVPTVLVFRSLTPVLTLALESQLLGVASHLNLWLSLLVILLGAVAYVVTDFQATVAGYAWLSLNLVAASLYHVYVKWIINLLGVSTVDMVLYNNALSVPILLVFAGFLDK